ncbi:hypothetical protein HDU98_006211 [Podochytrium sp. JEL0797]|nr:hypothetical protein HDU98_006211 [Podochytrium sp. JEL0797]
MAAIVALGHLGTTALASMALATLFANVTGYSIVVGMGSAIDTLCSQSYGEYLDGRGDKKELGRHLTRSLFIMYLLCIPISILWWFTEPLLLLLGQDASIAHLSGKYTTLLIPSLIPFVLSEYTKRFLMSQGIMSAQMLIIGIVAPLNCLLQYVLVISPFRIGAQGEGASIALVISHSLIALSLILYVKLVKGGDSYGGWEWPQILHLKKLWIVTSLGVSGVLMTCSEWWAWEIVALIAGLLSPSYLAAQTIVLSASFWTYTIPLGVAIACTTRIGNALGAQRPDKARLATAVVLCLGLVLSLLNSLALMAGRSALGSVFSDDPEVIRIVGEIVPLVAAFQIVDGLNCICGGILRGAGRPEIGAILNMIAYYLVGIPFGLFFCFQIGWNLYGLWVGLTIALFALAGVEMSMIWQLDWDLEAENAHKRSMDNLAC